MNLALYREFRPKNFDEPVIVIIESTIPNILSKVAIILLDQNDLIESTIKTIPTITPKIIQT